MTAPNTASPPSRTRRSRRRRRTAVEAFLLAVGVALLLWGADKLAEVGAETLLERNLQSVSGVAERPVVDVKGPLFLPQAIRGVYREVHVQVSDITSGPLTVRHVDATLYDVRMPFRDLLLRDIRRVGVGRAVDDVTLRFDDLNAYFETTGRSLRLSGQPDGQVQLTGSFDVLGETVPVSAQVELVVDGSQLRIAPRDIETGGATLSAARQLLLEQRVSFTIPLDTLPFGHQLTAVTVNEDELRISAESTAIVLQP